MNFDIEQHTILKVLTGSRAYGLATPESDYDWRGVAIPPSPCFLGFHNTFEQFPERQEDIEDDLTIYDIRKFFRLSAECNPNTIELLWVPDRCIVSITPQGRRLIENRTLFLSQKAFHTFRGYAFDQIKRIETHHAWLHDSPGQPPTRAQLGLPEQAIIPASWRAIFKAAESDKVELETILHPNVLEEVKVEFELFKAHKGWAAYKKWKKERNRKRAELEAKSGYDTKHAMHLVRLLRMCREILTEGKVIIERPDREELLAIKNGAWKYEELMVWAEAQDRELAKIYESSTLPHTPDMEKLDALCEEIVRWFHGLCGMPMG